MEQNGSIITIARDAIIDDHESLASIMRFINGPKVNIGSVRVHNGHLLVTGFVNDHLSLSLVGNCIGCPITEGTRRMIAASLIEQFEEITVEVKATAVPNPGPQNRLRR
jgi:Fe-S cluster biogenesis protein NfuA